MEVGSESRAAGGTAPEPWTMHSYNMFSGNQSFEQGGDPTNDDSDGDGSCDASDLCPGSVDGSDFDADGLPDGRTLLWVLVAMVGAIVLAKKEI